MTLVWL